MEIAGFDNDGEFDLAVFIGASSGLLGQHDVDEGASVIELGRIGGAGNAYDPGHG